MNYSLESITEIISNSVSLLQIQQPMLFIQDNDISEETVSTTLHAFLSPNFPEYHLNCEYNRMTDENGNQISKRIHRNPNAKNPSLVLPDIIVHHQEDGRHNLLVIEIKMAWKNREKEEDYNKLIGYTSELRYKYGLYLELGEQGITEMTWFQNGKKI
ncbi:hypothetical protein KJ762_06480 [bacterium]|nr:hypothetical protein [bacterium]MBU1634142.1 hypothetical protein [bacterium]MBU1875411.1 hypothetical protein [bacterium]